MILDAKGAILGRLAARAAKSALGGEEVMVVNAEKAIISGDPDKTLEKYQKRRNLGNKYNGPFQPRAPDKMVRRAIRGMLGKKKAKGREALKRVKVFVGQPEEMKGDLKKPKKTKQDLECDYTDLKTLSKRMGWRPGK